jgi:hypothetical protein
MNEHEYTEEYLAGKEEVFTTGFPRSGNTWLNRLLSDLLSSAMQTKPKEKIEYFGPDPHNGDYVVRKTHFYANQYSGYGYSGDPSKMILIRRDPRDMAVSVMFYRGVQPNLKSVIDSVFLDKHVPGIPIIGYRGFTEGWDSSDNLSASVKYEQLQKEPIEALVMLAEVITGKVPSKKFATDVAYRQRFDRWASRYPGSMRKGITGDWQNYFRRRDGEHLTDVAGDIMLSQGYIEDLDWWKELRE